MVEGTTLLKSDIEEARAEIQKAIALLVNRFGHDSDLWKHLQLALDRLREPAKPRVIPEEPVVEEAPPPDPVEEDVIDFAPPETGPEVAPPSKRRAGRKG